VKTSALSLYSQVDTRRKTRRDGCPRTLRDPCHFSKITINPTITMTDISHSGIRHDNTMSRSTDPGHFFQTDASEAIRARRAAKSENNYGNPIKLQSKILDIVLDPIFFTCVFVAESAGNVRRVNIDVGKPTNY
jgi:hypothetical protein